MTDERVMNRAEFNPKVCTYWLLSGAVVLICTVVGIPLLLLWFPIGFTLTKRYMDRMSCELTEKSLKVKKGIFVRVEKTIPLEKITDVGMVQGPIMRQFDLHQLTFETAGQSGTGALVSLTGIMNAKEFREAVLNQRTVQGRQEEVGSSGSQPVSDARADNVLLEIRDALLRIETKLNNTRD